MSYFLKKKILRGLLHTSVFTRTPVENSGSDYQSILLAGAIIDFNFSVDVTAVSNITDIVINSMWTQHRMIVGAFGLPVKGNIRCTTGNHHNHQMAERDEDILYAVRCRIA